MEIDFGDDDLKRLYTDPAFAGGWAQNIVKAYRRRVFTIQHAVDERDLYALKGLRFEKLKGKRKHQHSVRLNDQWRLILELVEGEGRSNRIKIIEIEDYH